MKRALSTLVVAISLLIAIPTAHALTVFDPSNYSQNLLGAVRALEQINNQIKQIQNQIQMVRNMERNLKRLDFSSIEDISRSLRRIDTLIRQAETLGFDIEDLEEQWRRQYPERYDQSVEFNYIARDARARWKSAMEAYRQTMRVQADVVNAIKDDAELLERLTTESQGAVGSLQAQQATAQLIALSAKQQMQIQSLMAAQYRAQAQDAARKAQIEEAAKAATRRFLGDGEPFRN